MCLGRKVFLLHLEEENPVYGYEKLTWRLRHRYILTINKKKSVPLLARDGVIVTATPPTRPNHLWQTHLKYDLRRRRKALASSQINQLRVKSTNQTRLTITEPTPRQRAYVSALQCDAVLEDRPMQSVVTAMNPGCSH